MLSRFERVEPLPTCLPAGLRERALAAGQSGTVAAHLLREDCSWPYLLLDLVDSEAGWPWAQSESLTSTSVTFRGYKAGSAHSWQTGRSKGKHSLGLGGCVGPEVKARDKQEHG